jgi:hypothetical protein
MYNIDFSNIGIYVWVIPAILLLIVGIILAEKSKRQKEKRFKELLAKLGPARGPCLMHSAWTPYRPIIRIEGDQNDIFRKKMTQWANLDEKCRVIDWVDTPKEIEKLDSA